MTYLQFLGQWYNLPWLAAVVLGLLLGLRARLDLRRTTAETETTAASGSAVEPGPRTSLAAVLVTAGVAGLTLNGAIHDFELGSPETRFPVVAALSLGLGWLLARVGVRLRYRFAPPVTGLAFNRAGLEGAEAVVVSASTTADGTMRARHRDVAGVVHIVRIRVPEVREAGGIGFGSRVRLGAFDRERGSYEISAL